MPQSTTAPAGSAEATYQTPQNQSNNNAGNAALTAQLTAVPGKTNYCTGYGFSASGATAAAEVDVQVTGLTGGTRHHAYGVPVGATAAGQIVYQSFSPPIPATGPNIAVVVTMPAGGAGQVQECVQIDGYAM